MLCSKRRAAGCDADERLRCHGIRPTRGQLETYRGHEYKTNLLRKIASRLP